MSLTQKQENFCIAFVETGNASEAYRRAYNASNMKPETVVVRASEMMAKSNIKVRVEELRQPVIKKAQITLESHLERLQELSLKAEAANQYAAAIKAEEQRGKAAGIYVEKVEHSGKDGGPIKTAIDATGLSTETIEELMRARRNSADK